MAEFRAIQRSGPCVEGRGKVLGAAQYAVDVVPERVLWAKVLRSPHSHARIRRIDARRARALPGVAAVLTAESLPDRRMGRWIQDLPLLARDTVRFVGERVAIVAAEDPDTAEEALELVEVEYEPLPAVFDTLRAVEPDAPLLHPDFGQYGGAIARQECTLPNVNAYQWFGKGDIAQGWRESAEVFERRYRTQSMHQLYLEPHASVVRVAADGHVTVWTSTQAPYVIRRTLAAALDLPEERITVVIGAVGGGFGGKVMVMEEAALYYLARATGRPVKLVLSSAEELRAACPRHPMVADLRLGVDADLRFRVLEARLWFGSGAYAGFRPLPHLTGQADVGGPYSIPHVSIDGYYVYTNTVPRGYMRGPAGPAITFAVESLVDEVAAAHGVDPGELRRRNAVQEGEASNAGERWHGVRFAETLALAMAWVAAARRALPPNHGVGLACAEKHIGSGESGCLAELDADGRVRIVSGVCDIGNGALTVLHQIAAEGLGAPLAAVRVEVSDTDAAPFDSGTGASRVTHVAGRAVLAAATALRARLTALAAAELECPPELLEWVEDRLVVREQPGRGVRLADLARRAAERGQALQEQGTYSSGQPEEPTFATQAAVVRVDPATGQVTVLRLFAAHDVGRVLNPLLTEGQVHGGLIQGLGYGLMEELLHDGGAITNAHLGEYKIPCQPDVPSAEVVFVEGAPSPGPYDAKAIGEICTLPTAAAIANAVYDAVGVRVAELPLTPERVYRALAAHRASQPESTAPRR